MIDQTDIIKLIAGDGIALVENLELRDALLAAYDSPASINAVEAAHRTFTKLTALKYPPATLCRFLSGWNSMHGTSLFVSGLLIRVLRKASELGEPARALLCEAATEIGEVIPEDTGLDDVPHNERFMEFANYVAGNDQWKLDQFAVDTCREFRSYIQMKRLSAPLEEGILMTAASENWNTGEYTWLSTILRPWLTEILGRSNNLVDEKLKYVTVHAGQTELGHFLHALRAWEMYCAGIGQRADPLTARRTFEEYFKRVGAAFRGLEAVISR